MNGRAKFKARLQPAGPGGAWLGVAVPAEVVRLLGASGARPAVKATVNGKAFLRSLTATKPDGYILVLNAEVRRTTGLELGDYAQVVLEAVSDIPEVPLPPDVQVGLTGSPAARDVFERLPASHRQNYLDWIAEAKRPETRRRRIERMLTVLVEPDGGNSTAAAGEPAPCSNS